MENNYHSICIPFFPKCSLYSFPLHQGDFSFVVIRIKNTHDTFGEVPCLVLLYDPLHKLIPGHFFVYINKICMYYLAQRISWV